MATLVGRSGSGRPDGRAGTAPGRRRPRRRRRRRQAVVEARLGVRDERLAGVLRQ